MFLFLTVPHEGIGLPYFGHDPAVEPVAIPPRVGIAPVKRGVGFRARHYLRRKSLAIIP